MPRARRLTRCCRRHHRRLRVGRGLGPRGGPRVTAPKTCPERRGRRSAARREEQKRVAASAVRDRGCPGSPLCTPRGALSLSPPPPLPPPPGSAGSRTIQTKPASRLCVLTAERRGLSAETGAGGGSPGDSGTDALGPAWASGQAGPSGHGASLTVFFNCGKIRDSKRTVSAICNCGSVASSALSVVRPHRCHLPGSCPRPLSPAGEAPLPRTSGHCPQQRKRPSPAPPAPSRDRVCAESPRSSLAPG